MSEHNVVMAFSSVALIRKAAAEQSDDGDDDDAEGDERREIWEALSMKKTQQIHPTLTTPCACFGVC